MGYFEDIYKKRVNRYGLDYQSRIQRERAELFDLLIEFDILENKNKINTIPIPEIKRDGK